ncbi:hypothetical protein RvY_09527 [Ramazzottius varieornatus]|uniref:ribose-5-phosphate isomerase n=1 Tax=Ramazzottius varieornatus TaxID=947166 RepID=A0A1D1VE74_RAMVA|nr:hypothetical protein RvY_09527 [Ramazzottius varieornatus]
MSGDAAKRAVAKYIMSKVLQPRTNIKSFGLGSGTTIELAMREKDIGLAEYLKTNKIKIVPTSFQAYQMVIDNGLEDQLTNINETPMIDLHVDGADEVDENLTLIKGGGGCFLLEKTVALHAKELVIVATQSKRVKQLGQTWTKGIPIEIKIDSSKVVQCDYSHNAPEIKAAVLKKFGGDEKKTTLRQAEKKCGPVVTDAGNLILDWSFPTEAKLDWKTVDEYIKKLPGVAETGIFVNMAKSAYFGHDDGNVTFIEAGKT